MTSRFAWVVLVIFANTMLFPNTSSANTDSKTKLVFEIKTFPIEVEQIIKIEEIKKTDERIYMHEPEIRAYVCPKMGLEKCNIFIAILKAENGTHECTRDNRGLNRNGSIDVGLAQINWNPKHNPPYTMDQLRDCKFNLDIALQKYKTRGFQPWYAYTKGAYKKFLSTNN